jgi:chromosome segregation ATPase
MNSFLNNENLKSKLLELDQIKQLLDDMRKKNNELCNEKQQLEIKLSETESKKKTYEQICSEKEKQLAEKENLIFELSTHKQKTEMASRFETNDNKLLQKEIKELREKNHDLESKLNASRVAGIVASTESVSQSSKNFLRVSDDLAQQPILASQNKSLTVRVKALEAQIEELNKDREKLIIYRDELIMQLDEKENDVANQNEALKKASFQYLMEKNALTEENTKAKNELNQMNEAKERLVNELEAIRTELSDKKLKYEQLSMTRLDLEQRIDRETGEHERHLRSCDSEMRSVKEQLVKLNEKLALKETNLISTENDLKYTKMQIDERQKQIIELKEELSKSKADFALHLELFRKEKEEKENLLKKCDALEESIKKNIEVIKFK